MALRHHHYECAFEHYLRSRRIPYVAVDEARKALLPKGSRPGSATLGRDSTDCLKSFDFVIYGESTNLLVDVKGRRIGGGEGKSWRTGRLESWVTMEDVESLRGWQRLFGPQFEAVFVFAYACVQQPPDALFQEVFEFRGAWYVLRTVGVDAYAAAMKLRSQSWRTVHVPGPVFQQISHPFAAPGQSGSGRVAGQGQDCGPDVPALQPFEALLGSAS